MRSRCAIRFCLAIGLLCSLFSSKAMAQSVFTYQDRLTDSGTAIDGSVDHQFSQWDAAIFRAICS
ncbi:MAG: hypothetical protein O7G85_17345 [Planctomycetota bacterium]|nr:hypothetical protein [Planctomycetota bacterium]